MRAATRRRSDRLRTNQASSSPVGSAALRQAIDRSPADQADSPIGCVRRHGIVRRRLSFGYVRGRPTALAAGLRDGVDGAVLRERPTR